MPTSQTLSQQPLISFIVTTYNIPVDMLLECLKSITSLSLTSEQREIIVIDDGSDISPVNVLGDFLNDIIYVRQSNHGLSMARNLGLRIANGKFIQFVDGDDCLIQAEYEHCLDIIRYNEPVDMVLFYTSNTKSQPVDFSYEGPITGVKYMENNNIRAAACAYIFRAERLGGLRFTPGIFHEDEEFTPRLMLQMHNVYSTKSKAYYYRKRKGSITHTLSKENKDKRLRDTLGVIVRLQTMSSTCESDQDKREALNRRIAQLTMDYIVNVIRLTRSGKRLENSLLELKEKGLYPLPDKHYTKKYVLFNKMIKNKAGRIILLTLL